MPSPYSCDVARREVLRLGLYAGGGSACVRIGELVRELAAGLWFKK